MPITCIVFEDPFVDRLRPVNLARPTFSVTVGAFGLAELLARLGLPIRCFARPHLRALLAREGRLFVDASDGPLLYLNAALLPDRSQLEKIIAMAEQGTEFLAVSGQRITAAYSRKPMPAEISQRGPAELVAFLLDQRLPVADEEFDLLEYFFDVLRHHERLLPQHLSMLAADATLQKIRDGVYAGPDCRIAPNAFLNPDDGPILLGSKVRVQPFAYVAGPVRIGDHSIVNDHAAIKHGTVLGRTVKVGGETESTIIESFSNKQHHGFLGHAYVGSWVNLGAGTSNSDLKNTYGECAIEFDGRTIPTGMQFLGCVVGDFTKTAINTSIFTGKLIGVASFLYGFVSTNVPSFTNYARSFGQVTEVSVDVAIKTQARVARRRNVEMTDVDSTLLRELFEMTRAERQLSSEQVVL